MQVEYSELELAYLFVSDSPFENSAAIGRETGRIYCMSELGEADECPEDIGDEDKYLYIPGKYDLDLGNALVFEFARRNPALDYDEIRRIFRRKGAYARFGDLLDRVGLRDKWHEFQDRQTKEALVRWCEDNNIEIVG